MLAVHTESLLRRMDHVMAMTKIMFLSQEDETRKSAYEVMEERVDKTLEAITKYNPKFDITKTKEQYVGGRMISHEIKYDNNSVLNVVFNDSNNNKSLDSTAAEVVVVVSIARRVSWIGRIKHSSTPGNEFEIDRSDTENNCQLRPTEDVYTMIKEALAPDHAIRPFKEVALRNMIYTHFKRISRILSSFIATYFEYQLPLGKYNKGLFSVYT